MDAHHVFPQARRFQKYWKNADINIHNPSHLKWWEKSAHRSRAKEYNKHWDVFFRENKNATPEEIQNFGNSLMKLYGF